MANFDCIGQICGIDIVGAVEKNNMDAAHACKKRQDAVCHDLVLAEEAVISNVAAGEAEADDDDGEDGAPPAVQESRVVGDAGPAVWWRSVPEGARYYHAAGQSKQALASAEGELLGVACSKLAVSRSGSEQSWVAI